MSSYNDRDKRLNSFNQTFKSQLEDTNKQLRNDIKQIFLRDFEDALRQAEFSAKKGDMLDAYIHLQRAQYLNSILKGYD